MTRLVIIGSILAAIITCGIVSIVYLHNTVIGVNESLTEITSLCHEKSEEEAVEKIKELSAFWESRQSVLSLFMRRGDLDGITELMGDLKSYVHSKSFSSAFVEINRISLTINHIYEREIPSYDNLF